MLTPPAIARALRAEVHDSGLVDGAVHVVVEERVHAVLALLERAVRAAVHGVALVAHDLVLVPQVVRVRLLDGRVEVVVVVGARHARAHVGAWQGSHLGEDRPGVRVGGRLGVLGRA